MLAYEDVPKAKAPVMVLPIDVGHSIGVVQDPGVTQRVTDDGDSNDQGTNQGVDHQGKSVLPPSRGLCDGRCCAVKRTRAFTQCPTCYCVSDPDPSMKCTLYGDGTNDTFVAFHGWGALWILRHNAGVCLPVCQIVSFASFSIFFEKRC